MFVLAATTPAPLGPQDVSSAITQSLVQGGSQWLVATSMDLLGKDPEYKNRKDWKHMLKPSVREVKRQKPGVSYKLMESTEVVLTNDCPHCKKPMERPARMPNGQLDYTPNGKLDLDHASWLHLQEQRLQVAH